ncbi:MAG: 50S ribosomal protein L32 [Candidatus Babeliales bacterium]
MPVPKRKRSRARRDSRHANWGLEVTSFATCGECSQAVAPHTACKNCGFYKGAKVIRTKTDRGAVRQVAQSALAQRQAAQSPEADASE